MRCPCREVQELKFNRLWRGSPQGYEDRVLDGPASGERGPKSIVRTGSWMGPPEGERAPRVGPISIVILARE